jgi:hypothetical protein
MNRHLIALAMLTTVVVASNQDEDWFPAPDGYVWPAAAAKQPTKEEQVRVVDLPVTLRSYLAEQWKPQPLPESIYACRADLNGDGVMEWFIDIPVLGGSGGGYYDIIAQTKTGFRSLGGVQGGFELCMPAKGEKWLRIEGSSRAGGGHVTRYLMQLRGTKYIEARNEDHDYNAGKATVRK